MFSPEVILFATECILFSTEASLFSTEYISFCSEVIFFSTEAIPFSTEGILCFPLEAQALVPGCQLSSSRCPPLKKSFHQVKRWLKILMRSYLNSFEVQNRLCKNSQCDVRSNTS